MMLNIQNSLPDIRFGQIIILIRKPKTFSGIVYLYPEYNESVSVNDKTISTFAQSVKMKQEMYEFLGILKRISLRKKSFRY